MLYISNAFSLSMLANVFARLETYPVNPAFAVQQAQNQGLAVKSCVGHSDIAQIISKDCEYPVTVNRESIKLQRQDHLLVAQYSGPRLPEGATSLPEGAAITYIMVHVC